MQIINTVITTTSSSSSSMGAYSSRMRQTTSLFWTMTMFLFLTLFAQTCHAFAPSATPSATLSMARTPKTPTITRTLLHANNNNNNNGGGGGGSIDKGFNLLELASKVVPQGRIVSTAKGSWKFLWQRFMVELAPQDKTGNYQRPTYGFGNTLGSKQYPIEGGGRYEVLVGNPCPWCHRVRLVVNVLGLQDQGILGVTVLKDDPIKASRGGWVLTQALPQVPAADDLRAVYEALSPPGGYQGRCTAPLLVDWKTRTIVSNESKDIVRMLPSLASLQEDTTENSSDNENQNDKGERVLIGELVPAELQSIIDETNEWIYRLVNNGVYRCGFATSQDAYNRASADVLQGLAQCETILSKQDYLCSPTHCTESDLMLLPTMLRFDGVYAPLFRAGGSHLRLECDYPSTFRWLQRCWREVPGVATSIDVTDACDSYYRQLFPLNPGGLVPSPPITAKGLRLEE